MENLDKKKYENAKKRVKKEKDFYTHLTVYIVINTALLLMHLGVFQRGLSHLNIPTWSMFTTPIGWGIGLFFHWLTVFKDKFAYFKNWEDRKIKEYMDKEDEEIKKRQNFKR